jgi:aminoglycoside phosphotransferase (APT) family kinase protein
MESRTKRQLSRDELHAMVREAFGSGAEVAAWSELPEGTYNAAYAVALSNPELDLVLKVAPDPTLKLLTYEVDLMRTEAHFYRRAAAVAVPVPEVVFADFSRRLLATDYVFLSRLPGSSLRTLRDRMSLEELGEVRTELAKLAARLHTVTGTAFGYPLRSSRSWQPTWRASFSAMVDDLVSDAVRLGSELPARPEGIAALLHRHDDTLDDVERPALVHFDLWDGNVFVDRAPGGRWRITGLIDGERAFFGDPVAEFVSLALYRDLAEIPDSSPGTPPVRTRRPPGSRLGPTRVSRSLVLAVVACFCTAHTCTSSCASRVSPAVSTAPSTKGSGNESSRFSSCSWRGSTRGDPRRTWAISSRETD